MKTASTSDRTSRWWEHPVRRLARATLAPAVLLGALGLLGAFAAPAAPAGPAAPVEATGVEASGFAAQADEEAADEEPVGGEAVGEDTLTWSVRPTPTESEPERPNFSYDVDPGATVTDSIRVRNYGDEPLPLAIYASDAMVTSSGALDLLPAGEEPTGVGAWIMVDEIAVEVPPQDFVDVPFTMVVPGGVESGDHTGGIVTSYRSPGADNGGQPVVLDRRLGSRVHVRVNGDLYPELEVSDLAVQYSGTVNPVGTGTLDVTYTVTNTGNVRLAAEQLVKVPGRFGVPGREAELDPMPELLPGSSLSFTAEVPDVWPTFRSDATVELDLVPVRADDVFDPDLGPAAATEGTWSVPWTHLALLLVALAVPAWALRRRRQRRQQQAAATQQATQTAALVQDAVQAVLAHQVGADGNGGSNGVAEDRAPTMNSDEGKPAEPAVAEAASAEPDAAVPVGGADDSDDSDDSDETTKIYDKLS